jgi:CheY-like chemotaxis protein/HPt (histidine-containing phosphotransfer) domain-containing protein
LDADFLRRSPLLHAVAVAAGRCSPEAFQERDAAKPVAVAPPSIAEARAQGQLLLIAEDDEINKKVILRQIELLGYAAEIADNGADALRLWRAGDYALLLTDLNMPEMDGYVLAETIRREEAQSGSTKKERMPILAFTANALRGEAVRAQAAGMDDYLTKPLQLHLLKAAIAKWLPKSRARAIQGDGSETPRSIQETPVIDIAVLERLVGPEPEIVRDLLAKYQASAAQLGNELRDAQNANDLRQIGAIAHKLKSGSRSVGALPLGDLCAEVENACRTGSGEGISEGMTQIEAALRVVDEKINELLER